MGNHNPFCLVSDAIIAEILRKKQLLEGFPDYYLHSGHNRIKFWQREAAKHSVSLELEGYDTTTIRGRKAKAKESGKCRKNLRRALSWGIKNYQGELDEDFIRGIGLKVDPDSNSLGYRNERVRITGATCSPPAPEKLPREMGCFLLENESLNNIIDKALHSHFHLTRIHPFLDGNGRTSRLVQNVMLEDSGFFPVRITEDERKEYVHLLDRAVYSYVTSRATLGERDLNKLKKMYDSFTKGDLTQKEKRYYLNTARNLAKAKMTPEQNEFYNFVALKIRDVLQKESERLFSGHKKAQIAGLKNP